jgi:colanic acid/amylovoran biosynthesis glycosyltransferase
LEFPWSPIEVVSRPRTKKRVDWWLAASIEVATGRSPWRRRLDALLARLAPDVIHAHFGPNGCLIVDAARSAGIPLVTSLYGVDAAVLPYLPQWRDCYARLFAVGDRFLAEGPEMRAKIIAAGAPADRTHLQPIAINLDAYPSWTPDAAAEALFVGRFVEKKGLLDTLSAFARARARVPGARLIVVGGGPEEVAVRQSISDLALTDGVTLVGMKPHSDVIARLRRASVLVHPSVTAADGDSEGGAPTILLEAQAIGTPIVTTRHADIPNVVPAGPGVWLCEEHDVDAIADGLVSALTTRTPSSRTHVATNHDVANAMDRLESHYDSLVASRAKAAAS